MSIVDKLLSKVQNPADKLSSLFEQKAETALLGALNDAFAKIGLGASSRKGLLGNLAGAALASLASEVFGGSKSKARGANTFGADAGDGESKTDTTDTVDKLAETLGSAPLTFPSSLGEYKMQIEIKEYKRPNPTKEATYETKHKMYLPLPRTLEDRHEVSYDSQPTNLVGAIADRALGASPDSYDFSKAGTEVALIMGANLTKRLAGEAAVGVAEQLAGAAINPNLGVFFKGPTLREHRFDWLLAPETEAEANSLQEIIIMLKQAALPNFLKENNTAFLQYPNVLHVKLLPWAEKDTGHKSGNGWKNNQMYIYKHAMIKNISVNYAPDSPVFIQMGVEAKKATPAFVAISMSIIEIEYFTADDYGNISALRTVKGLEEVTKTFKDAAQSLADRAGELQGEEVSEEPPPVPLDGESGSIQDASVATRETTTTGDPPPPEEKETSGGVQVSVGRDPQVINPADQAIINEAKANGYTVRVVPTGPRRFGSDKFISLYDSGIIRITKPGETVTTSHGQVGKITTDANRDVYAYRTSPDAQWETITQESYNNFVNGVGDNEQFNLTTGAGIEITIPAGSTVRSGLNDETGNTYIGNANGKFEPTQD